MPSESRPGPRHGTPLSHLPWKTKPKALDRSHEGTVNELLLSSFVTAAKPVDVLPRIVEAYLAMGLTKPSTVTPANYMRQRLYELKRRNCFTIRGT